MRKTKEQKITAVLAAGCGLLLLLIFIVNLFHYNYQMNADIASEAILGEVIWKSKQLIPDTWYPSTEVRVISVPNVAALFYGLTGSMTLSAGLACCVMTLLIFLAILYFAKSVGMGKNIGLMMGALCLIIPTELIILEVLYLFAGYYAVHAVILFITLAMYASFLNERRVGYCAIIGILAAFLLGLQGARGILVIYGPLFGVELIRNIYFVCRKCKRKHFDFYISLWTLSLLIANYIGTRFPFSVKQGFSRNIRKGLQKLFTVVIPDMGRAIGFESADLPGKICLGVLLLLTVYLLFYILRLMWKREKIDPIYWVWMVMCASPVLTALIVAFTTVESTDRYYFILLFLLVFSAVIIWKNGKRVVKNVIGGIAIFLTVSNLIRVYLPILKSAEPPATEEYQVTIFLKERGLSTAYATFENANTMTVLSDGIIHVYPVATVEKMDICKWLTSTDGYCPNIPFESSTAYIITDREKEYFSIFLNEKSRKLKEAGKIGKYTIYVSDYNYSNLGIN